MNKILVTVVVPSIEESYDVYIPISKTVKTAKRLLVKTINELSEGHFPIKECTLMSSTGVVYDINLTLKEVGVKNADKIVLI